MVVVVVVVGGGGGGGGNVAAGNSERVMGSLHFRRHHLAHARRGGNRNHRSLTQTVPERNPHHFHFHRWVAGFASAVGAGTGSLVRSGCLNAD